MYVRYGNDAFMEDFFNDPDLLTGIGAFFGIVALILIICLACTLVLYILRSIGLYRLAENRGMSNPGLAWIPLVGIFRAGSVADDIADKNGSKTYFRYFILGGYLCSWVLSGISASVVASTIMNEFRRPYGGPALNSALINQSFSSLGSIIGLAVTVIIIISLNKIYKCYTPASSTSWTVLSVIFPFLISIFLFIIRNRAPVMDWYDSHQNYYPPSQPQNWQGPPPNAGYQQQPPPYAQQNDGYYPPQAPNPPEPWEISDSRLEPPVPPWNSNDNPPNGN